MATHTPESLSRRIHEAFEDVLLGDAGISLYEAMLIDDYWLLAPAKCPPRNDIERQWIKHERKGRWQDLPPEMIVYYSGTLPFMNFEGRRFHLPAFMVITLDPHLNGQNAEESVLQCLGCDQHIPEFERWTEAQRTATADFVRHESNKEDAQWEDAPPAFPQWAQTVSPPMQTYWQQYETKPQ
ncbi:MAG: DUF6714 family protein [Planctomycetaceae bacterium]